MLRLIMLRNTKLAFLSSLDLARIVDYEDRLVALPFFLEERTELSWMESQ